MSTKQLTHMSEITSIFRQSGVWSTRSTVHIHSVRLLSSNWSSGYDIELVTFESWVQFPAMPLPGYFWDNWPSFVGKLSWAIITTRSTQPWILPGSSTIIGRGKRKKSHHCRVTALVYVAHENCVIPYGMWFPVAVRWFPRTAISALLTYFTHYTDIYSSQTDNSTCFCSRRTLLCTGRLPCL